jgi:hypothetical protein
MITMDLFAMKGAIPFKHDLSALTAFSPESLVKAVRAERHLDRLC